MQLFGLGYRVSLLAEVTEGMKALFVDASDDYSKISRILGIVNFIFYLEWKF